MTKILISTVFLFIFSFSAAAKEQKLAPATGPIKGKNILKFIAKTKTLRDLSLYQIMKARCNRYSHNKRDCKKNISHLIVLLDFDMEILDNEFQLAQAQKENWQIDRYVFAAFKKIFLTLLNLKETTDYLEEINKITQEGLNSQTDFNLWDYTVRYFDGDEYVAAGVIASLFQDTSLAVTHLEYVRNLYKQKKMPTKLAYNLDLLSDIIIEFSLFEKESNQASKKIFFPQHVNREYFTTIYHFFVPYFLTLKLKKENKLSSFQAKEAALMLTLSYEFATSAKNYQYLFQDPQTIDIKKNQHKLQDIYTAYKAVNLATGEDFATESFYTIATAFSLSTSDAVKNYLLVR